MSRGSWTWRELFLRNIYYILVVLDDMAVLITDPPWAYYTRVHNPSFWHPLTLKTVKTSLQII